MIRATSIQSRPPAIFGLADWMPAFPLVAGLWRELLKGFLDPYRPERHYMRGPGPNGANGMVCRESIRVAQA